MKDVEFVNPFCQHGAGRRIIRILTFMLAILREQNLVFKLGEDSLTMVDRYITSISVVNYNNTTFLTFFASNRHALTHSLITKGPASVPIHLSVSAKMSMP